ncbi:hypothetical protein PIB30_073394 [Stylosanthes scabra]|uniref:Disease resistance protein RPS4B/Roq1-like leucine-rich repeats domain-containing protein n=1 Tax=Stylosanthes scabra TaxID=79078 RepID=A0ABU6QQ66_9FABA|nr:hypothetical protein [Stylosanthes scabra]
MANQKRKDLEVKWDGTAFKEMENLKTLIVKNGCFSRGPKHLPNSLRVLEWRRYPSKCFPYDFHPKKLTILKLPEYLHLLTKLDSFSKARLSGKEMRRMPWIIGMMPQLCSCHIVGGSNKGRVLAKQEEEGLQGMSTHDLPSSNVESLILRNCELSDVFYSLAFAWFPNVTELDIRGNNFTILPECIQEFHFLRWLNVDDCHHLREIRGIPPCLRYFSAMNCKSLSPMDTSVLLNQELHENGESHFVMPGRIPRWFERHSRRASISFWFRGSYFPDNALCVAILLMDDLHCNPIRVAPTLTINGKQVSQGLGTLMEQLFVFDLSGALGYYASIKELRFENEWNHAEVSYKAEHFAAEVSDKAEHLAVSIQIESIAKEIGIHGISQPQEPTLVPGNTNWFVDIALSNTQGFGQQHSH